MRKWLCSRFAWRFGLRRLALATVFLGAFLGLNMWRIGPRLLYTGKDPRVSTPAFLWGWPLPLRLEYAVPGDLLNNAFLASKRKNRNEEDEATLERYAKTLQLRYTESQNYELPLTHQSYRLLDGRNWRRWVVGRNMFADGIAINTLVALITLFLILFLQIPRPKEPSAPPPVRDGG